MALMHCFAGSSSIGSVFVVRWLFGFFPTVKCGKPTHFLQRNQQTITHSKKKKKEVEFILNYITHGMDA
uniref:Uncharacterized protein n=1 Tax=Solanum lycopersicum TaxID=4081 RepID=A0A3Q7HAG6_SOLLC